MRSRTARRAVLRQKRLRFSTVQRDFAGNSRLLQPIQTSTEDRYIAVRFPRRKYKQLQQRFGSKPAPVQTVQMHADKAFAQRFRQHIRALAGNGARRQLLLQLIARPPFVSHKMPRTKLALLQRLDQVLRLQLRIARQLLRKQRLVAHRAPSLCMISSNFAMASSISVLSGSDGNPAT